MSGDPVAWPRLSPPVMHRADDDDALVIHAAGGFYARTMTTRCLGRLPDGSDRASAEAMAARLVATGYTEARHPMERP